MRELAKLARIQDIQPIKDKDRIELATIENYPVIVEKGKHKVGDLVVYVFYDTVLPQRPEFEFLRARCWSKMYQGFRIRNMSMAGHYSSGIIFGLDILPTNFFIEEGKEVSEVLGIQKYDPEERLESLQAPEVKWNFLRNHPIVLFLSRYEWFRRLVFKKRTRVVKYPVTVQKSDEENIEKVYEHHSTKNKEHTWYITEKMEGQAGTWLLLGTKRKYMVFSRNMLRSPNGSGTWETIGREYNLHKILKSEKENYAIQGEICGPGIQGNIYEFDKLTLFVYKVTDTVTGKALNYQGLLEFCAKHNLPMVPLISKDVVLPDNIEKVLKTGTGKSTVNNKVPREGVVWRSTTDQNVSFKAKSRDYAVWFENRNKTV